MNSTINRADQVREVWTSDEGTMAQQTAASRWPKIVQGMIDDFGEKATTASDAQKLAESIAIQISRKEIKNDMEQNKPLRCDCDCYFLWPDGLRNKLTNCIGRCQKMGELISKDITRSWLHWVNAAG